MDRRSFLRVAGIASGGLFLPKMEIEWPPSVVINFKVRGPYYALTIDDGWTGPNIEPFLIYAASNNIVPFTWFANGTGIRRIRESESAMRILLNRGIEIGYHTMHHPTVSDQYRYYNRERWIEDYDEWRELAIETCGEKAQYKVKPYARAAGGYFSDPFLEMCDARSLLPIGWSKDPYVVSRGAAIRSGDIFLTHFRASEWKWFKHLKDIKPIIFDMTISAMIYLENCERGRYKRLF